MIRIGLAFALLVAVGAPAGAQMPLFGDMRGTPEDQRACRPDAVRLCKHVLGQNDAMVVLACFQRNRAKLSAACRAVLQKYGQ